MMPGSFGRYQIESQLGQGGMGVVYKAFDPNFGRQVALKVLPAQALDDPAFKTRFNQEAQTIATLEHPAIVPVYDFGEDHGQPYLVMRLMEGGSLAHYLAQDPLNPPEVEQIISRIARAMDAAHRKGFVHRDIKPGNILLDKEGQAYLSDFGLAKLLAHTSTLSERHHMIGTPAYMSPEQVVGNQPISHSADIYALGAVIYHLLAGRPPYLADTSIGMAMQHLRDPVPHLLDVRSDLPPGCDAVVARAMAKNPSQRFPTAAAFAHAFRLALTPGRGLELDAMLHQAFPEPADDLYAEYKTPDIFSSTPVPPASGLRESIYQTSTRLKRQFSRLPAWARGGILSLALVGLLFVLLQVVADEPPPSASPTAPSGGAIAKTSSATPPPPATVTTGPIMAPNELLLLSWGESAVWQLGSEIQRIPEDGRIRFLADDPPPLFESGTELMKLILPDRTRLFLDHFTTIEILQVIDGQGIDQTEIRLVEGKLAISTPGPAVAVFAPNGAQALSGPGLMGVEYAIQTGQLSVDCLQASCQLKPQEQEAVRLAEGEGAFVDNLDQVSQPDSARYEAYRVLVDTLPTPTHTPMAAPTADPTATATFTPTPLLTPTLSAEQLGPETLIIGRSASGKALEAIRLGIGERKFIFIGGLHAGFAPNSVDLAEATIAFYRDNLHALPEDVTLYVLPNMNPDSLPAAGQYAGRLNANNVDLNRNWGCRWSEAPLILGQSRPGAGGSAPFSEPENQALVDFIAAELPTAVIFWEAHSTAAAASPGACIDKSRVSVSLAQLYGSAAGYDYVNRPEVLADPNLTGDASNFLDHQNIPAIVVLLPNFSTIDWEKNLGGITAVINEYGGVAATPIFPFANSDTVPAPATNCQPVDARWAGLYERHQADLGCPINQAHQANGAFQLYANGLMVWRGDNDLVYVLYDDHTLATYAVDQTPAYNETDLHKGAFGYLWLTNAAISRKLGEPQQVEKVADAFVVQDFNQGSIFQFANHARSYLLFSGSERWLDFPE